MSIVVSVGELGRESSRFIVFYDGISRVVNDIVNSDSPMVIGG